MDELLTVEETAKILKYIPQTVKKLIKENKLKGQKVGNEYRVRREDLENFIEGKTNA